MYEKKLLIIRRTFLPVVVIGLLDFLYNAKRRNQQTVLLMDCWHSPLRFYSLNRVVDPDPDWIRIQRLCGSGSVLGIRIQDPDPEVRKLRNFSGNVHFLVIFNKNFTTKKV
jgi:hypothetical protein